MLYAVTQSRVLLLAGGSDIVVPPANQLNTLNSIPGKPLGSPFWYLLGIAQVSSPSSTC